MVKVIIICMGLLVAFILTIMMIVKIRRHFHRKALERKLKPWQDSLLDKSDDDLRMEYSDMLHRQIDASEDDEELDMKVDIIHNELKRRYVSTKSGFANCKFKPWFQRFIEMKRSDCD
ncbi:MAG: hypothetical protein IKA03_00025 [Alphaproteobacteria bacterium]|nr:hypothetical protein [Alphaproteobacteria bacterium]